MSLLERALCDCRSDCAICPVALIPRPYAAVRTAKSRGHSRLSFIRALCLEAVVPVYLDRRRTWLTNLLVQCTLL
jgi:hypothetical protein